MNTRKSIITGAMALGLLAGSAGIASAFASGGQADPTSDTTAPSAPVDSIDAAESDDAQEPELNSSIQTTDDESLSEADESAVLAELATVTEADATKTALDANPGATFVSADLENDNGSVVYEVELTDVAGLDIEVKVDAGNGKVLAQETDDEGDDSESDESDGIDHENEGDESGTNGNGIIETDEASEATETN